MMRAAAGIDPKIPRLCSEGEKKRSSKSWNFLSIFPSFAVVSPRDRSHRSVEMCCLCGEMLCSNGAMSGGFSPKWGPYIDPPSCCRSPWPFFSSIIKTRLFKHQKTVQLFFFSLFFRFVLFTPFSDKLFSIREKKDKLSHIFAIFILLIYTTTLRTHLHFQWNILFFFGKMNRE